MTTTRNTSTPAHTAIQRPDYRASRAYDPAAALRAQAIARRIRRRVFWQNVLWDMLAAMVVCLIGGLVVVLAVY